VNTHPIVSNRIIMKESVYHCMALLVLLLPLACSGQPLRIVTIDSAGGASAMARDSQGVIYFAEQGSIRKGTPTGGTFIGHSEFFRDILALVVAPNGDIFYVADDDNSIRKMTQSGNVSILAGQMEDFGLVNGRGTSARFDGPTGIAMDSAGNLFVTEQGNDTVRKVRLTGDVTTFVPSDRLFFPQGLAIDSSNNLYVLDSGFNRLRKVTAAGAVTTLASLTDPGDANAHLPSAVAVDKAGNVYVADTVKSTIKRISASGAVETVAGVMYSEGTSDGVGSAARFLNIRAILAEPDGSLLIADGGLFRRGLLTVPLPSETIPPVVTITSPTANQRWSNAVFTARGTASDNQRVTNVCLDASRYHQQLDQLDGHPNRPAPRDEFVANIRDRCVGQPVSDQQCEPCLRVE
jgi:hypothetical protein